jgi:hypothetical protein
MIVTFRECLEFGAPGDDYDDRPTVAKRGSTHVDTAFMGLTSSLPGTVVRTISDLLRYTGEPAGGPGIQLMIGAHMAD